MRNNVTEDLWKLTRELPVLHFENWTNSVTSRLKIFENDLIVSMKKGGWDGSEDDTVRQWTFAGALFYSIIVITTIGNGIMHPNSITKHILLLEAYSRVKTNSETSKVFTTFILK